MITVDVGEHVGRFGIRRGFAAKCFNNSRSKSDISTVPFRAPSTSSIHLHHHLLSCIFSQQPAGRTAITLPERCSAFRAANPRGGGRGFAVGDQAVQAGPPADGSSRSFPDLSRGVVQFPQLVRSLPGRLRFNTAQGSAQGERHGATLVHVMHTAWWHRRTGTTSRCAIGGQNLSRSSNFRSLFRLPAISCKPELITSRSV